MFEHIYLSTWKNDIAYATNDIVTHKDYSAFTDRYPDIAASDSSYLIHGTFRFLLPRPYSRTSQDTKQEPTARSFDENPPDAFIRMQSFSYGKLGKNYYTERKNYPSYLLLFTYHGEGLLRYEGKEYSLKRGDLFFINCKKYHYYRTADNTWEHSDLHLQGLFIDQFYEEYQIERHPVFHFSNIDIYQEALEKALRCQTGSHVHWAAKASHGFENLLFLLTEQTTSVAEDLQPPENIMLLRTYLESNFRQNLSLDEMSAFCGISKYHLCREFKRYVGFSPREYMIKMRICQAQLLLQSTSIASYKVGLLCGFENEANFIRQFKKYSDITPEKYRRKFTAK